MRPFGPGFDALVGALEGDGDEFLTRFTRTAQECIDDGADVILAGGQLFCPVFTRHGYYSIPNTGVPVVEVAACGLKIAESLVALRLAVSLAERGRNRFGVAYVRAAVNWVYPVCPLFTFGRAMMMTRGCAAMP